MSRGQTSRSSSWAPRRRERTWTRSAGRRSASSSPSNRSGSITTGWRAARTYPWISTTPWRTSSSRSTWFTRSTTNSVSCIPATTGSVRSLSADAVNSAGSWASIERFVCRAGLDPRADLCFARDLVSDRHPLLERFLGAYPCGASRIIAADAQIRERINSAIPGSQMSYVIINLRSERPSPY